MYRGMQPRGIPEGMYRGMQPGGISGEMYEEMQPEGMQMPRRMQVSTGIQVSGDISQSSVERTQEIPEREFQIMREVVPRETSGGGMFHGISGGMPE